MKKEDAAKIKPKELLRDSFVLYKDNAIRFLGWGQFLVIPSLLTSATIYLLLRYQNTGVGEVVTLMSMALVTLGMFILSLFLIPAVTYSINKVYRKEPVTFKEAFANAKGKTNKIFLLRILESMVGFTPSTIMLGSIFPTDIFVHQNGFKISTDSLIANLVNQTPIIIIPVIILAVFGLIWLGVYKQFEMIALTRVSIDSVNKNWIHKILDMLGGKIIKLLPVGLVFGGITFIPHFITVGLYQLFQGDSFNGPVFWIAAGVLYLMASVLMPYGYSCAVNVYNRVSMTNYIKKEYDESSAADQVGIV